MIAYRTFANYEQYAYKQGGKARGRRDFLLRHLEKNTESFARYFREAASRLKPGAVLCLGARTGAESLGAVAAGFKGSVGMDLHPVGPTVVQGDWHQLTFADASFANAYCNSLDHCLDLARLTAEVKRVLIPDGRFYVMATNRTTMTPEKWESKGGNEAMFWESSDDLRDELCKYGFELKAQWGFDAKAEKRGGKWGHYVFTVTR